MKKYYGISERLIILSGYLTLSMTVLWSCSMDTKYLKITEDEYMDKMKAAWVGQMAGVGWGGPTEFKYTGEIIPLDKIPAWRPELVNQFGQDDIYVELTFMSSLEKYGPEITMKQAGIDFANTGYMLWAANYRGRENLRTGIAPPESGHPHFSKNADDIDYQIEADYSGIIAPGIMQVPVDLGEKFGRIMNYGDGLYGGQFIGGMYAAAFFENDPRKIIEAGLKCIPDSSQYANCVRDILEWHRNDPFNWQETWQKIEEKYYRDTTNQRLAHRYREAWPDISAKINGAYVVLGLLYGNGDPDSTIVIATRCGRDSDCNPSSAAGVLFTTIGFDRLPTKFRSALNYETKFSFSDYDLSSLIDVSRHLAREYVVRYGGRIENEEGKVSYLIPDKEPQPAPLEQSWDPGPFDPENRFTEAEKEQIKAYPVGAYDTVMTHFAPRWEVLFAGKTVRPGLDSAAGRDSVLITAPMDRDRGVLVRMKEREDNLIPEGSVLHIRAGAEKDQTWILYVNVSWKNIRKEIIGDEDTPWEDIEVDLAGYLENKPDIELIAQDVGGTTTKILWNKIEIIQK